jgi:apolipoprotein D and lipocalin family protein
MTMKRYSSAILMLVLLLLAGCARIPEGIEPVTGLDLNRYLGHWYEIARLDHSFERGLSNVTATYRLRRDGGIEVVNRGYDEGKGRWREARGRAYPVGDPSVGRLKVSFFGPFYGGYNILALDRESYGYALVCGPNRDYLWILARSRTLSPATLQPLIAQARQLGFDTDQLIYPVHDRTDGIGEGP